MGDYLSTPNKEKIIHEGENGKMRYAAVTMQGWRRTQEDAHISQLDIGEGISLFAVFDGHGGHEVAQYSDKHFVKELKRLPSFKKKDYRAALTECFLKMDTMMMLPEGKKELSKLQQQGLATTPDMEMDQITMAGATANVLMITKTELYCANAGDSRCVISRKGKVKELSQDHKPDNPAEKRRIERANGFVEENRVNGMLALSRSLGDFEYKNNPIFKVQDQIVSAMPDVTVEKITGDMDFAIIACDGIWDCMSSQEAVTFVAQNLNKKKKNELSHLVGDMFEKNLARDAASSAGIGCDNMTCIIVEFKR